MNNLLELLKKFKIAPKKIEIYISAFTHPSLNGDNKSHHQDYERLEFIGDSVLNFIIADLIYHQHDDYLEGEMTKLRSHLVKTSSLANFATKYQINCHIRFGASLRDNNEKVSSKILENVFEAFIGAIYLDQGIKTAYRIIKEIFLDDINNPSEFNDYKTQLQEAMQADHRGEVQYKIVETSGPAHNPHFVAEVFFGEVRLGRGEANSIKEAQQQAAKNALQKKAV